MAKKIKVGSPVVTGDPPVRYVVTYVDEANKTADIKSTRRAVVLHRNVPWSELTVLDASQNAVWVVMEATENH
jgi:hypothetical protein